MDRVGRRSIHRDWTYEEAAAIPAPAAKYPLGHGPGWTTESMVLVEHSVVCVEAAYGELALLSRMYARVKTELDSLRVRTHFL